MLFQIHLMNNIFFYQETFLILILSIILIKLYKLIQYYKLILQRLQIIEKSHIDLVQFHIDLYNDLVKFKTIYYSDKFNHKKKGFKYLIGFKK